jgi:intracellular multiplication protein IcmL
LLRINGSWSAVCDNIAKYLKFYQEHKIMSKSMKFSFSAVLIAMLSIFLTAFTTPQTADNTLDKPVDATQVLVFANEAAVAVYSYNFLDYRQNLQMASRYFTSEGWTEFKKALKSSHNLDAVVEKKLVISAVAQAAPVILEQGVSNGTYTWEVQMPMLVTYQSATQVSYQRITVKMSIQRSSTLNAGRGLAVSSLSSAQ